VINHITNGPIATRTGTGISTLLIDARLTAGTLSVDAAFGPAVGGSSQVTHQTGTGGSITLSTALGVGTTRRGYTGINWCLLYGSWWFSFRNDKIVKTGDFLSSITSLTRLRETAEEGIARVTGATRTNRTVIYHSAEGLFPTSVGTGIDTLLVHTGLVSRAL